MANRFKEKEKQSVEKKEFAEQRKLTSVNNTTHIHNTEGRNKKSKSSDCY